MIRVTDTLRMRRRARKQNTGKLSTPTGLAISLFASLVLACITIGAAFAYVNITHDLPSIEAIPLAFTAPDGAFTQPTRIYDRSGENLLLTLENPAAGERRMIGLDDNLREAFSKALIDATISTQEPNFWSSNPTSILISPAGSRGFARQIVLNRLLWDEAPGLRRDMRERLLAAQLLSEYGHEKVLAWYLNSTDYGRLAFGAEAASQVYFAKSAADLSPGEAAYLAAAAQAPALNPHNAPEAARERMRAVLDRMTALDFLDEETAKQIRASEISIRSPIQPPENPAPAFLNYVLEQMSEVVPLVTLEQGGFEIITTLEYDLQTQANCTRDALLMRLGVSLEDEDSTESESCQAARLLPTFRMSDRAEGNNIVANAIIYDPIQAQILVMIGDLSPGANPAVGTDHVPGTLATTFVYLSGFTRGLSPATLAWDVPGKDPTLESAVDEFHGPMRIRTAFANDYLPPAASVLSQVGPENVRKTAQRLGIPYSQEELNDGIDILTDGGTNLLDLVRAYGIFANAGILTGLPDDTQVGSDEPAPLRPVSVLRMQDMHGRLWFGAVENQSQPPVNSRPVITNQLAYLITNVLSDESARWQSMGHPNALEIGTPIAAKMGRTLDGMDAWTIGYTPEVVIGVRMGAGRQEETSIQPELASDFWHALAQYTLRNQPAAEWQTPPGISRVDVCSTSGLLPTPECPTTAREVFLTGTEPTQRDYLYKSVQVNRQTGRLATVFTPPENLEEQVFLSVPPEARAWAEQAGLPAPPEEYDILNPDTSAGEKVRISSPGMFSYVRGEVTISGSAGGDGFQFYRLQAGKGLNPQEWLLIEADDDSPVIDGVLGRWDTSGLSGLYALQLLVVGEGQRVESAVTQVTVDNEAPRLSPVQPQPGQVYADSEAEINIRVDVTDDLALESVAFQIDSQRLGVLSQPPYQILWESVLGSHKLTVEATDQAGNISLLEIDFIVR